MLFWIITFKEIGKTYNKLLIYSSKGYRNIYKRYFIWFKSKNLNYYSFKILIDGKQIMYQLLT